MRLSVLDHRPSGWRPTDSGGLLTSAFLLGAFALSLATWLASAQIAPMRTAVELSHLQGHWEGEGSGGKCSITIKGNSLHYRNSSGWHETTFTLPAGTDPQQLHATIKDSSPQSKDSIGTMVFAICKIEDGTLTLAVYDKSQEPPKTFDGAATSYVVKKVQPPNENAAPPNAK